MRSRSQIEQEHPLLSLKDRFRDERSWFHSRVGKGWAPIVMKLVVDLDVVDDQHQILQIKEKFGGLRYYFSCSDGAADREKMDEIVTQASLIAAKTCEDCGAPAELRYELPWIRTLCDDCFKTKWEALADDQRSRGEGMVDARKMWAKTGPFQDSAT